MPKTKALLSLGCNLGDRQLSLKKAVKRLQASLQSIRISSVYQTSPVDFRPERHQPAYYNMAVSGDTDLSPEDLLAFTQKIETAVTSEAVASGFPVCEKKDKGPRYLDIDIVFYGDRITTAPPLIPHPAYRERLFVIIPLLEIEPAWQDPVTKEKISAIWQHGLEAGNFTSQEIVKLGKLEEGFSVGG